MTCFETITRLSGPAAEPGLIKVRFDIRKSLGHEVIVVYRN